MLALTGALLVGLLWAETASGQEQTALTKSGVTRLLTGGTYSPPEVAGIIRRSCLTFQPTRRDLDDFREMGADDEIIRAITTCARERERGAETPAGSDSLHLPRREITAAAGDTVSLVARVRRNDRPQPGVRLVLEGTRRIREGPGQAPTAISDSAGRVVFRVPVGTEIGHYSLEVTAGDGDTELGGESLVSLSVRASAPFRARVTPDSLSLRDGEEASVVVRVRDRFGNPIRDADVSFRSRGQGNGETRWAGVTDRTGETRIEVAAAELGTRESLGVLVEGELLTVLPVRGPVAARADAGREDAAGAPRPGEDREGEEDDDEARRVEAIDREEEPDETGREEGREGSAALGRPPLMELALWGGHTFDNNRDPQPQTAELAVWPTRSVRLWGRYDDALNIEHSPLVRGEIDYRALYAGARVKWGARESLRSLAEFGRRVQPLQDVIQTLYRFEQEILLGPGNASDFERFSLRIEGILGHWHDRDDYLLGLGLGIPVSRAFRLASALHHGETVGTVIAAQRIPARETRLALEGIVRSDAGWGLDVRLTTGNVDSEEERLSGELLDVTLRTTAPLGGGLDLGIFSRYQSPPGMDDFVEVGLGLTAEITR